jgi:hypothetical protein
MGGRFRATRGREPSDYAEMLAVWMREESIDDLCRFRRKFATQCPKVITEGNCENRVKPIVQDAVLMNHAQKTLSDSSQLGLCGPCASSRRAEPPENLIDSMSEFAP